MSNRLLDKFRASGFSGLLIAVMRKLPRMDYFVLYSEYRAPLEQLAQLDPPGDLEFDWVAGPGSIADLERIVPKPERFRQRLAAGGRAVMARSAGRAVGFLWFQLDAVCREERHGFALALRGSDIYDYDGFVADGFRGRGVLRGLHQFAASGFVDEPGRSHFMGIVEDDNRPSIRALLYMGFTRGHRRCAFQWGPLRAHWRVG